jgi:DNA-directed RNA polymerase subunit RPC12/RpoP
VCSGDRKVKGREVIGEMIRKIYVCKKCGMPFQPKEEEKEPKCAYCGSKEVVAQPVKPVTTPSCGTRGRFT